MKIGILYICTGKYKIFWKDFYLSCEKNFIPEAEKHYFVFTDSPDIEFEPENKNIHRIYQKNLGWPDNTLRRYEMFLKIKDQLVNFDYLFFFNADLIILEKIMAQKFLPTGEEMLVACIHPGYYNKPVRKYTDEINPRSTAFITRQESSHYYAGGINGGKTASFIQAMEVLNKNIEKDLQNNIIAKWHDESHWNKYLENRTDIKILNPGYLYPEASIIPFKRIVMIRDKRKYLSYQTVGKKGGNSLVKILRVTKKRLEKNGFIQRSLTWQLFKKWIHRLNLLRTIYRNDKLKAIRSYLGNDLEYFGVKREIESFRSGGIYDFKGIKLPLLTITPDTFLNVIKPFMANIEYTPEQIEKFYQEQKGKYKTLTYWKDNYPDREPDYIGGHLISHGFPYFFKEIKITKEDIVVDLGAAPGDFSAICIKLGASKVYAFEPEENAYSNLDEVSKLNGQKIDIIRKYCGAETNQENNSITLDDFVRINNLAKVDFIKSDIEGGEVKALEGAKNVLKKYKPKLTFCTYHSIDDAHNIERVILDANPNYIIYKQKGVIYAV